MIGLILRRLLTFVPLIAAVIFGLLWIERARMDYNSEGRFFDEQSMVVYDEGGVLFFGLLTVVSLLIAGLAIGSSLWARKRPT
ncbi:MAG TPA: hypothetical protein PKN30_09585 [Flavobacteriales bacterium]|nr:hypothetical protein [Flavobacteriales bacterium]